MNKDVIRQVSNIIAVVAVLVVNWLANALPLNGKTSGEISNQFDVYFVPANYVFSIWGLIYLGLIVFAVFQTLPAQRENPRLRRVGYLFVGSCVANITWLFLWHYEYFGLTLVAMFTLLFILISIYEHLRIGRAMAPSPERWLVDLPFSLYLGWITVATLANVATVLVVVGWNGWGISPELWTIVLLIAATGIASVMGITRRDAAYILVIMWAFVGIAVKQEGPLVSITAWAMTVLLGLVLLVGVFLMPRRKRSTAHAP